MGLRSNKRKFTNYFSNEHDILAHGVTFFDHNYTVNRVVTDLDWSPQISDLLLASYS